MTLEQYSAAVDAWVWIDQQIHMYGPGLALTAACIAISWTSSKIRAWREKRATRRQLQHIERYANHPGARRQHRTRKED